MLRFASATHLARATTSLVEMSSPCDDLMRVRTVALLSGEQKMAADWSRAAAGCYAGARARMTAREGVSRADSVGRCVAPSEIVCRPVDHCVRGRYHSIEMPSPYIIYRTYFVFIYSL